MNKHFVRYEPPDIAFWRFVGDLSEADMQGLLNEIFAQAAGREYLLLLVDFSSMGRPSPAARRLGVEKTPFDGRGTAIFAASASLRILAITVSTAYNLLAKRTNNPIRFFDTEVQARAWLDQRRLAIQRDSR